MFYAYTPVSDGEWKILKLQASHPRYYRIDWTKRNLSLSNFSALEETPNTRFPWQLHSTKSTRNYAWQTSISQLLENVANTLKDFLNMTFEIYNELCFTNVEVFLVAS